MKLRELSIIGFACAALCVGCTTTEPADNAGSGGHDGQAGVGGDAGSSGNDAGTGGGAGSSGNGAGTGGDAGSGDATDDTCEQLCAKAQDVGCAGDADTAACLAGCEELHAQCHAQLDPYVDCIVAQPLSDFTCDEDDDDMAITTEVCDSEEAALKVCLHTGDDSEECKALCDLSDEVDCEGDDRATCLAECAEWLGACPAELYSVAVCFTSQPISDFACDEDDEAELVTAACDDEESALEVCVG